jgi:hypothetical protein
VNIDLYTETNVLSAHPRLQFFLKLAESGFTRPPLADYTKISDILSFNINAALKRETGVAEALNRAEEMIRENRIMIK